MDVAQRYARALVEQQTAMAAMLGDALHMSRVDHKVDYQCFPAMEYKRQGGARDVIGTAAAIGSEFQARAAIAPIRIEGSCVAGRVTRCVEPQQWHHPATV
jgi:hypothetical protein